jgi:predicted amidophosphoribosyltransferase
MMSSQQGRLSRERHTIQVMIEIYCHGHHHGGENLCSVCQSLFAYAMQRIDKCPLQANKPTCAQCPVHCYKPDMRDQIRSIMRYSGPRMMIYHPILTILHYRDEIARNHDLRSTKKSRS